MYVPINATITATSLLFASKYSVSNLLMNEKSLTTSSAVLVARQDDTQPPLVTSIQLITSITTVTSEPASKVTTTSRKPDAPSAPPPPSTTAATRKSSEQPPTKTNTPALASSTSRKPSPSSTAPPTKPSATTATALPTQTPHPEVDPTPWLSRGKIAGIVVGCVLGLIILSLIAYALYAASHGINVCNCFGGCCGKHYNDDDDEVKSRNRLPSRSEDTYPYPDSLKPGGGYRAYHPVRVVSHQPMVPLPLVLPQQVDARERRGGRLQRGYRGA